MNWLLLAVLLARVPEDARPSTWPESLNMHSTGRWNRGTVQAVKEFSGKTYIGTASSILTRQGPTLLGRTDLSGIAQDLLPDEGLIYAASGRAGLTIYQIDQNGLRFRSQLDLPGYAWSLSKDGNLVMVASGPNGLFVVDVARPEQPRLICNFMPAETVNAVLLRQDRAYLAAAGKGLTVLDVHDPKRISVMARFPVPGTALNLALRDTFLWLACGDSGVLTVNVARPHQPLLIRRDGWPGAVRITISDSFAAIPAGPNGLYLVNIARPDAPYLCSHTAILNAYAQDAAVLREPGTENQEPGTNLCLAAGPAGLLRFDITNPFLPRAIDTLAVPGYTRDIAVRGSVAWVATSNGLYAVDIGSGQNQDLGRCLLRPGPIALALTPDMAAVAMGPTGIGLVTTNDPAHPALAATLPIPGYVLSLAARDSWVWVGTADSGIQVVRLASPQPPLKVGSLPLPSKVAGIGLSGDLLAAALGDSGVWFSSLADPRHPVILSRIPLSGRTYSVSLLNQFAAACGDSGLFLIDISQPRTPYVVRHVPLATTGWRVLLKDTLCYVAQDWAGLVAFRLLNLGPLGLVLPLVGYYASPSVAHNAALTPNRALVADVYSGLFELTFDPASGSPKRSLNPGPGVKASQVIRALAFNVVVQSDLSSGLLSLLDPTGRTLIRVPIDRKPGDQQIRIPTQSLGAGVYFLRFETPGRTSTCRICFLR
jgi:hypothetical protein